MPQIKLTLVYPPSVNHYWAHRAIKQKKTNRTIVMKYLSSKAKAFRQSVNNAVKEQLGEFDPLYQRLAVTVHEYYGPQKETSRAVGQAQDIDNCLKPLLDALENSGVFRNDSQIDQLLVLKKRRAAVGRVEVIIKTLE